jgi:plastocyanin
LMGAPLVALVASVGGCNRQPERAARGHIVEMRGMEFHPAVLDVRAGDTITWINGDMVPHTATAAGHWDTGPLSQEAKGRFVALEKGEWSYVCTLHPTMSGKLVVR